jgi:colanic acid/amylovoran biosynthesis glycosyltransferase
VTAADGDTEGGAPVSIIEAMASGMPVVATTHCDIPAIVSNNHSGLLVPERDVDALVDRLDYLISRPGRAREMGRNGRTLIEKNHSIKRQVEKLEEIYRDVTGSPP